MPRMIVDGYLQGSDIDPQTGQLRAQLANEEAFVNDLYPIAVHDLLSGRSIGLLFLGNSSDRMDSLTREYGFYPATMMGIHAGPANPYGLEGYKTIAFEVAAQLGRVPDRMCVPTSGGDALYGPFKGFRELLRHKGPDDE